MNILIFNPLHVFFDETWLDKRALGGSESWAVQVADEFQRQGHQCYVVCWCGVSHVASNGARYIDRADIKNIIGVKFDFAICMRLVGFFYKLLSEYRFIDSFFVVLEDTTCPDATSDVFADRRCKKVIVLSDWHKEHIKSIYGLPDSKLTIIPNGIDERLFNSIDPERKDCDNSIFWSSRAERGLSILSEDIAPIVRAEIPDFTVRCATYADNCNFPYSQLNVVNLGSLPKSELYAEMSLHGVWFYPSTFDETFCITAIENMMCGNNIVMYPKYGTEQYAEIIEPLVTEFTKEKYRLACEEAASKIVYYIRNFGNDRVVRLRRDARRWVMENFTWKRVVEKFIVIYWRSIDGNA